ncbi:unnamed protein product [Cylicocyclus nassatus]|uniref:Uncharacterized protein n=1 Tax=Cylicocyclus nassatus TaxID=53992 RepID=A0AA36MEG9_CYLNA|nr:unnamed protein product [Cylicocyclus nassatus]
MSSLYRLLCAVLLMVFLTTTVSSSAMFDGEVESPATFGYIFKKRDVPAALPYELPEHLLKAMLKYRRY